MSSKILPSSSAFDERAIADASDTHGRIAASLAIIPHIGRTVTPPDWTPWLLRNRGLQPLMAYVDWQTLLDRGQAWLRIRGTPQASVDALGWVGWHVRFEAGPVGMGDYDHYHIHLPDVPWRPELERIIAIERQAKSTDSVFYRLTHGWDDRRVRGSMTRYSRHIFSFDSGVYVRPDWPILSFRARADMLVRAGSSARASDALTETTIARRGHIIFSCSRLPERATPGPAIGLSLDDATVATSSARAIITDEARPLAGIVGGRSRFGARQSVFAALRHVPGERPRFGLYRFAGTFRLPHTIQLTAVPEPLRLEARLIVPVPMVTADIVYADAVVPQAASPVAAAGAAAFEGATIRKNHAPWSALPWRHAPWGDAAASSGAITPDRPEIVPAAPVDLRAARTNWGDIVLSFAPPTPGHRSCEVDILNGDGAVVRTLHPARPDPQGGRIIVDYPVEMSIPDSGWPPQSLTWRVRGDHIIPKSHSGAVPLDNAAIVARTVGFAGQSNAVGHFSGHSGAGGRRDLVSAGTMRRRMADLLGLRHVEVMPVNLAWGSSAADRRADDNPAGGVNYWWDLDGDAPGPRLTQALDTIAGLGVPVDHIIWAQGENDASAANPNNAPRHSTPERYRAATEAIIARLRTATGGADIWIQALARAWRGDLPAPPEVAGVHYRDVREAQCAIAAADAAVRIGTWTPGAEDIAGYVRDGASWLHYTAAVYHAAAAEMAESIAANRDLSSAPPSWTQTPAATGIAARRRGWDIVVEWQGGADEWIVHNVSVAEFTALVSTATVHEPKWTFPEAEQVAAYGNRTGGITLYLAPVVDGLRGPTVLYSAAVAAPSVPVAPSGFVATKDAASGDITVTWEGDGARYRVINRRVDGDNDLISDAVVPTARWVFPRAEQVAVYGYPVSWISIYVSGISADDLEGPPTWQGGAAS